MVLQHKVYLSQNSKKILKYAIVLICLILKIGLVLEKEEFAMHIFLTGNVQVGKSTVINRVLEALNVPYKGFRTYGAEYKEDGSSVVYISPADNPDDKTVAAYRGGNGHSKMEVNKDAFEVKGVEILKNSLNSDVELILMDEIGFMESHFEGFKDAIRDVLNSDKNILGVVRNKDTDFLNEVRNHASVQVVIVNNENRNDLPETLVNMLRGFYGKDSNYKRK